MTLRDRLRKWLLGTTSAPPSPLVDDRLVRTGLSVSYAAQWEANRTGKPVALPDDLFARPVPPAGVLPAGLAMDALPAVNHLAMWGLQSLFHEGLAFPGYSYLAELAQRPEYRHMADIWAEHGTRKWIKLTGPDEDRLGVIEAEMGRLNVRAVFRRADEIDGQFGRSHIYLDFGDGERSQRLMVDARKVSPARPLRALRAVEPMWVYPGAYESMDPLDADFYRPRYWYVQGQTVADSRFLTFVRHPVPDMLKPAYAFGGQSYTQLAKPYVDNWLRTRQSVSDVTSAFSQMVLATDMSSTLTGGNGASLFARVDMFNQTRDNRGTMVIDKTEEVLTNVTTPLSGLDALQAQAQEQLSSVARIPLSIYLQVTPTGLNASSEGEIRSFYADVNAHQEKDYRPALQRVLELVQLGIDGRIDPDVKFVFESLWEMSALDAAAVRDKQAETDARYVAMGAIGNDEVRERLREEDGGPYQGLDLTGDVAEPDEDDTEDQPAQDAGSSLVLVAMDRFDPSEPRDNDGKWTSGGGSTAVGSAEFKAFFEGSKVTENGKVGGAPKPLYHGTVHDFEAFEHGHGGKTTGNVNGGTTGGVYFAGHRSNAENYIEAGNTVRGRAGRDDAEGRVITAYANMKNPLILDGKAKAGVLTAAQAKALLDDDGGAVAFAQANGHDGVILPLGNHDNAEYTAIVFNVDQLLVVDTGRKAAPVQNSALTKAEVASRLNKALGDEEDGKKEAALKAARAIVKKQPEMKKHVVEELRDLGLPRYAREVEDD